MIDPASQNSSFSLQSPGFQFALDSTSIGAFKTCPRYYQLSIVEGWRQRLESPHLTFGILLHGAREGYEHALAKGATHDEALDKVLEWLLKSTWDRELGRPWISDHPIKNRKTLIQTVVWYLDDKAKDDPLRTMLLGNGKPAVELSFRFDSGVRSSKGEAVVLCGHLDRIASLNSLFYIPDIKTSGSAVDGKWARQFSPNNQFSLYSVAGKVAFGVEVEGLIVDGIQVGVGFARFQRHLVPRTEAQLNEWMTEFGYVVEEMEASASRGHWRMNETACDKYGGCPFRDVCSRSPSAREKWLEASYQRKIWNPLEVRGNSE